MSNLLTKLLFRAFVPPVKERSPDIFTCGNLEEQLLYEIIKEQGNG